MKTETKDNADKWEYFDHTIKKKVELVYHPRSTRTVERFHVRDRDQKTLGIFPSLKAANLGIENYWLKRAEDQVKRVRILLNDAENGLANLKAFVNSRN